MCREAIGMSLILVCILHNGGGFINGIAVSCNGSSTSKPVLETMGLKVTRPIQSACNRMREIIKSSLATDQSGDSTKFGVASPAGLSHAASATRILIIIMS